MQPAVIADPADADASPNRTSVAFTLHASGGGGHGKAHLRPFSVVDHIFKGGATGMIPGHENRVQLGNRPNGIYVPRFRNVKEKYPAFLRGYGFQGRAQRNGWERGNDLPGFGADFKHMLAKPGPWRFSFTGFGECLPNPDNYLEIDKGKVDAWGIPTLRIHCKWRDNELAIYKDMGVTAAEMLEAAGAKEIAVSTAQSLPGEGIHELGSARMGGDPKTSVLNSHNQAHDVKNLFLTDGSCMASSSCVNLSLTCMALTAITP